MSAPAAVRRVRTFDSLRHHRNYRLYFAGQIVSVTGTWLQNVAQAWLIVELTHSPVAVGFLALCQFGPFALLGLVGGALTDRLDNRRILIVTQASSMGFAAILTVLTAAHLVGAWQVYALAAANGFVLVLDTPARQAFTIQMVGRDELPNAVALNSSLFNASRIIGPAIGGVIIAAAGVKWCFGLNALSYLAVLAGLLLMRPAELFPVRRGATRVAIVRGVVEGLRFARRTDVVRLVLTIMLFVGTISINFNVLLPVLTASTLQQGAQVFGILSASFGAGALAGALLVASLGRADVRVLLGAAAGLGAAEMALAPLRAVAPAALLLVATGVCFSLFTANSNATIQLNTPDQLRGRVLSLYAYVFFGTAPLGGMLTGWLSARGGTQLALLVGGGTAAIMAAYGIAARRRLAGAPARADGPVAADGFVSEPLPETVREAVFEPVAGPVGAALRE